MSEYKKKKKKNETGSKMQFVLHCRNYTAAFGAAVVDLGIVWPVNCESKVMETIMIK